MKELQKLLSKDEFNRFIYNLYKFKRNPASKRHFFKRTSRDLIFSFHWTNSYEGFKYWELLCIKYRNKL